VADTIGFDSLGAMALGIIVFAVVAVVGIIILGGLGSATSNCPSTYDYNTTSGVCSGCTNSTFTHMMSPDVCYWGRDHNWAISFNANETVSPIGTVTGGTVLACPNSTYLYAGTDFNIAYSASDTKVNVTQNARTTTWQNFTSYNNTNVSLYNASDHMFSFDNNTFVLFNCTDPTIVYNRSNFNLYFNNSNGVGPRIMMLSTGWIENSSVYCYNTSGSRTYGGATCNGTFINTTASDLGNTTGAGAIAFYMQGQIGNNSGGLATYTPALIAVAIGAIFIGLLAGFMGGRRNKY
jgi:hypothetical protein